MLVRLPADAVMIVQDTWQALARRGGPIAFATGCSGTDLIVGVLDALAEVLGAQFRDVHGGFKHLWACDVKESARNFITRNWAHGAILASLNRARPFNKRCRSKIQT